MFHHAISKLRPFRNFRYLSSTEESHVQDLEPKFETVFSFPGIKYIALINKLKIFQFYGTCVGLPTTGLLEMSKIIEENNFIVASSLGISALIAFSLITFPLRNTIGFIYVSEDNKLIKISSVNFLGNRVDKIIPADDWMPLLDLTPKNTDFIFLTPRLSDNSNYKLFLKYGIVKNKSKMSEILE